MQQRGTETAGTHGYVYRSMYTQLYTGIPVNKQRVYRLFACARCACIVHCIHAYKYIDTNLTLVSTVRATLI